MGTEGVIELSLHFSALARRPDVRRRVRRWDTCIEIDGVLHVREEGPRHVVPAPPGERTVSVWFRPVLPLIGPLLRYGRRDIRVDVPPGGSVRLLYEGSTFWHMGGRATLRVE